MKRTCSLKPLALGYSTINLDADREYKLGRSRQTNIRDICCSHQQIQLRVNLDNCKVHFKALGSNPCGLNGLMVNQNTECELSHGDLIEFTYGRHAYEVVFQPPMDSKVNNNGTKVPCDKAKGKNIPCSQDIWSSVENGKLVILNTAGLLASEKIAGYDLDGTIIKTKSGNVFPKNINDWQISFPAVHKKLRALQGAGFKICFFTNQNGIANGKTKLDDFKLKIKHIANELGLPIQAFIAIGDGYYRKPLPGMWEHLVELANNGIKPDKSKCFFVGDAAGRNESGKGALKRRKDHSLADRLFAENIGVNFYTPEEHFLGLKSEPWNKPEFEPRSVHEHLPLYEPETTKITAESCELILMIGLPGSGKSHFCKEVLLPLGYEIISADNLGSIQACKKACVRALQTGTSCVIDNTNVDAETRAKFIELAKQQSLKCRAFVMNVTLGQIKHNIKFREIIDNSHSKINDMVFNTMKKKYTAPSLNEGLAEVVKINFKPKFSNSKEKILYNLYLADK